MRGDLVGKFEASVKDVEGATIANGVDYKLYVALTGRGNAPFSSKPVSFSLANKSIYAGELYGNLEHVLLKIRK